MLHSRTRKINVYGKKSRDNTKIVNVNVDFEAAINSVRRKKKSCFGEDEIEERVEVDAGAGADVRVNQGDDEDVAVDEELDEENRDVFEAERETGKNKENSAEVGTPTRRVSRLVVKKKPLGRCRDQSNSIISVSRSNISRSHKPDQENESVSHNDDKEGIVDIKPRQARKSSLKARMKIVENLTPLSTPDQKAQRAREGHNTVLHTKRSSNSLGTESTLTPLSTNHMELTDQTSSLLSSATSSPSPSSRGVVENNRNEDFHASHDESDGDEDSYRPNFTSRKPAGRQVRKKTTTRVVVSPVLSPTASTKAAMKVCAVEAEDGQSRRSSRIATRKSRGSRAPDLDLAVEAGSDAGLDDLADQIKQLGLSDQAECMMSESQPSRRHSGLEALLDICDQKEPRPFLAFLEDPCLWNMITNAQPQIPTLITRTRRSRKKENECETTRENPTTFRKVGEASYSEVFAVRQGTGDDELVMKVIPLVVDQDDDGEEVTDDEVHRSIPAEVAREIEITRRVSQIGSGFVRIHSSFVVQGDYPESLIHEWDVFADTRGSDSVRPDALGPRQTFAVIVLSHGGVDLESFVFSSTKGWTQAVGMIWQVINALAVAEEEARFEHRDLHEGQILLRHLPVVGGGHGEQPTSDDRSDPAFCNLVATVVDFGLSRVRSEKEEEEVLFFEMTEDIFAGEGEQWDVYRRMREETKDDWKGFHPLTNVMWIHYLVRVLLHSTSSLKKPKTPKPESFTVVYSPVRGGKAKSNSGLHAKKKDDPTATQAGRYHHLVELEERLATSLIVKKKVTTRGRRKACPVFASVQDLAQWGRENGWIC